MSEKKIGLELLREPFPAHQISKLPKPTKQQTEEVKSDYKKGIRCGICGQWHHPSAVHLDYVGHAALTDRLLDTDPAWFWEPLALGQDGYPVIDKDGGMWIKLTVCGVTRLGYGDAQGKSGGDAMKERIGDALRNAAMRFGAALDLWHKGDLHIADPDSTEEESEGKKAAKAIAAGKVTPTAGTMDELSKEEQEVLHTLSRQVIEKLAEGNDWGAYETLEHAKLNNDQKIAIWTLFNSKQRATLKQMKQNELASAT